MAGQRKDLYQRFLEEVKGYVQLADELGFYGYCQPEHHLQIEGFEVNNHPGMFSQFVGQHSKRLKAGIMGYTMTTHNPVRVAEEIATLDHMLQGRLYCGFTRGYHARWVDDATKIVFSRTLDHVEWSNTLLIKDNLVEEMQRIKQQPGKDLWLLGSPSLSQAFMQHNLIDEYRINGWPKLTAEGHVLVDAWRSATGEAPT